MIPETPTPLVDREEKLSPGKLAAAQYFIVGILIVLTLGLWNLQVLGADNYRVQAEQNRIRKVPVLAPRGRIFDREGRLLVDNYPSTTCYLLRDQVKDPSVDLPLIAEGLHLSIDQLQATLKHYGNGPRYSRIPLKQDITPDEQAFVEAHRNELPELETLEEQRRLYPKDGFAAHIIGYVGEVSEQMLENDPRYAAYEPGDVVGKSGVEETYDGLLRGINGSRDVIVNSHGKELGVLGQELATPGKDLRLTIDLDLQRVAEQALDGKNGAIVAMDPHTGEILAMVSRPSYDPNQFSVKLTKGYWSQILADPNHPLLNKSIQAQLAPGSTFKIIMSLAGLQEGVAQNLKVDCEGGATFYGHTYHCDRHHGAVNIYNAIPYSCDTFYYTLANRLGIEKIAQYAHSVGLGQKTGIDLPDEASGTVPSEEWKMKTFHEKWFAGETISVGIGQGAVTATPLQLARALSGIASGGVFRRPHVLMPGQVPPDFASAVRDTFPGSGDATIPLAPENWQIITDAMANVTSSPIGTAYVAHLDGIDFAGKTGTADIVSGRQKNSTNKATLPNAWFVGMTPRRNPDIVVAVLWEHGYWGNNSAKLASQIIDAFVTKQRRAEHNLRIANAPIAPTVPVEPASVGEEDGNPQAPASKAPNGDSPAPKGVVAPVDPAK
jgi:penicillin-binding protein 2